MLALRWKQTPHNNRVYDAHILVVLMLNLKNMNSCVRFMPLLRKKINHSEFATARRNHSDVKGNFKIELWKKKQKEEID